MRQVQMLAKNLNRTSFLLLIGLAMAACGRFIQDDIENRVVARVGDVFLYAEDINKLLPEDITPQDSAALVTNYINNWAIKQLLLDKAEINLPEEQLQEFEQLVTDYRMDLYTRAYREALVLQAQDTTVTDSQLQSIYEKEKENFKLKEKLVQLRFVELPRQFLNKDEVMERLKRFDEDDLYYLDSIGVQFRKLNFNDSLWVPIGRVMEEIPPLNYDNEAQYLKKSQFFELEDTMGVYLGLVNDVRAPNEIAPLPFVEPTIKQILLNRRKLEYLRKLETELIDEATKDKTFEVYE
ncbi:peptidyl-prolyl cis-trans isomerase [Lentiprolixibacter aurantiacus]|uniref:Peptidyl-prolyl cis-trans isomerase n=1 Tax=Lentiprolixibacter aurantiacus TaxID=2993939 RepID=A0AAE3MLS8_9FLAO|nr:peptidyl-prolyl cis-trans isomerase [Lentiprolixibacter aurantiacus]MCX2720140.1 peptidyl-prolyl cis-trans isomerase [Lentiprolixibacter aurantiacus]